MATGRENFGVTEDDIKEAAKKYGLLKEDENARKREFGKQYTRMTLGESSGNDKKRDGRCCITDTLI
jgi:hypothetical protein